jgi:hypothetical protein
MKKVTLIAASLLAALNIYAQGDVVFDNLFSPTGVHNLFRGGDVETTDGVVVQLYASMTGADGTFMPVPNSIGQVGVIFPGYFEVGTVRIPNTIIGPGAGAFLEVRAWETAYGQTFEEATAAGPMGAENRVALRGISPRFMVPATGNPNASPPGTPVPLGDMIPEFGVNVPEPSVIALGLIGAGALLVLRRRK